MTACSVCQYDLSGLTRNRAGIARCPECGAISRPGPDWWTRDRLLTRDVLVASAVAAITPSAAYLVLLAVGRWVGWWPEFAVFCGPVIGTMAAGGIGIARPLQRRSQGVATFGAVVTGFCCLMIGGSGSLVGTAAAAALAALLRW